MSNAKRKKVRESFYVDIDQFEGKVVDIIRRLEADLESYGESAEIDIYIDYHAYGGGSYIVCEGHYWRDETDKEMQKRLDREKKAREAEKKKRAEAKVKKEEQERKELARLLKKYGGE
jgi:transposase